MFYINTPKAKTREMFFTHALPALLIFIGLIGLTLVSWNTLRVNVSEEQKSSLRQNNERVAQDIVQRMEIYENILRGGAGLFGASETVTREEWNQYYYSFDFVNRYPGIQGIGYVAMIPASELKKHEQSVRAEGFPEYRVFPEGDRNIYTSIVYIEPFGDRNLKAFGYDMYVDANRAAAMDLARDTGDVVISKPVTLVQEDVGEDQQPGILMFTPIYKKDAPTSSVEDRRVNLQGYAFAPFRTHDLMSKIVEQSDNKFGFEIYILDEATSAREILYKSNTFDTLLSDTSKEELTTKIKLQGTSWYIDGVAAQDIVNTGIRTRPSALLFGGLLFSFISAGFIYVILLNRTRATETKEDHEIQVAKDELLALASHQLRTPATVVKQYVGMLLDGYAGNTTARQKVLLKKAYQSNERQLITINEMLFVARDDAGTLRMKKSRFDLAALTNDIFEEHRKEIAERNQKYTVTFPEYPIIIYADKQYMRMAIENLVNNASKYTKSKGKLKAAVSSTTNKVILTISDTGVGVATADQHLLFKKFSRIPNEFSNKISGSGMGLYLTKKVIEAHDGTIDFVSDSGKGTKITITMPTGITD